MEEQFPTYPIVIGCFSLFQVLLTAWSYMRTRSILPTLFTLIFPFAGLPWSLYLQRETAKDNQVGGAVTYLFGILGIAYFLWRTPADEMPWMVIFTITFFAGIGVLNIIDIAVAMRIKEDGE